MSFKALEQTKHDGNGRPRERTSRESSSTAVPAPGPAVDLPAAARGEIDEHLVSLVHPTSFASEQYRVLRHTVEQLHRIAGHSIFGIGSPSASDGKTTTAINLAGALGQAPEARVLLVEADLRCPTDGRTPGPGRQPVARTRRGHPVAAPAASRMWPGG